MSIRDREVIEVLREEPELLALADAVAETQRLRRRSLPWQAAMVAALATGLFVLVLASPWDRGAGHGTVLERAYGAVEAHGPVAHMTILLEPPGSSPAVTTETFYDKPRLLLRVVSRIQGNVVADYTTRASEDQFATFPGLLDVADFYRKALATGRAKVVGSGTWQGEPVYWVRLKRGGRLLVEVGVDRQSYRPIVFRGLNPDGSSAGYQVSVLGLAYVSTADARFQPNAAVLAAGKVIGPNCRPVRARVGVSPTGSDIEIVSARSGRDGRFALRVDPKKSPFYDSFRRSSGPLELTLVAEGAKGFGFERLWRQASGAQWIWNGTKPRPLTVRLSKGSSPNRC